MVRTEDLMVRTAAIVVVPFWIASAFGATDAPQNCLIDRGVPVASSMAVAVEVRNGMVSKDLENLKVLMASRQVTSVLKPTKARVVREDSLWAHASDPSKKTTDPSTIWILDGGTGYRKEHVNALPMRILRIRLLEGEAIGMEGWIVAGFCRG